MPACRATRHTSSRLYRLRQQCTLFTRARAGPNSLFSRLHCKGMLLDHLRVSTKLHRHHYLGDGQSTTVHQYLGGCHKPNGRASVRQERGFRGPQLQQHLTTLCGGGEIPLILATRALIPCSNQMHRKVRRQVLRLQASSMPSNPQDLRMRTLYVQRPTSTSTQHSQHARPIFAFSSLKTVTSPFTSSRSVPHKALLSP